VASTILLAGYTYLAWRLTSSAAARLALAFPFFMVWVVPLVYWVGGRERDSKTDERLHVLTFVCMGWLNFLFVMSVVRDVLLLTTAALPALAPVHDTVRDSGVVWVFIGSLAAFGAGALVALRGPHIRHVDIPVEELAQDLDGLRIVQISDLHVGPTMRGTYVRRVVDMTKSLAPDLIALTGDIVDGPVSRLAPLVAPLAELAPGGRAFLVLGNHDYYAGAAAWSAQFVAMGLRVLPNAHVTIERGAARMLIGGCVPAPARPQSKDRAARREGRLRSAALRAHARRPVLPVDARGPVRPRASCGGSLAARPHVGLRQRGNRHVGSARAFRYDAGADRAAPRPCAAPRATSDG
jgi:hypothetical protein